MKHLTTLKDLNPKQLLSIVKLAHKLKRNKRKSHNKLENKSLFMIFEKPSLRTFLSFEVAMTQMGGHAIYYSKKHSPFGKGKETLADTAKVASRYADIICARMFEHEGIEELAKNSSVPVINALTNFSHPCQVIGDLLTIREKKKKFKNIKLAYMGDCNNNVTHSLLYGCAMVGIDISLAFPKHKDFSPHPKAVMEAKALARNSTITLTQDPKKAAKDADFIYTDSWMSYHIPQSKQRARVKMLKPYQVNKKLFTSAKKSAQFMHCLPATRGMEVTADIMDGEKSIILDQAENRLHSEKAIILYLLK